jgi:endonuclease-3 related protein
LPRPGQSRPLLLDSLIARYGRLPPPGGDTVEDSTPFEAIVRVALGLVADPRTASAAFATLRDAGLLEPEVLAGANPLELDDLFKQGRVRLAARALRPLQKIARWAIGRGLDEAGDCDLSTDLIRDDWRALNGVGPSTADALLLFALRRPTYPVDRASYRILVRHGWLDPSSDHDEARSVLEGIAPDDPEALAQLSLAFEKLGRDACRPASPRCDGCPLQPLLPEGGPVEALDS